MAKAKATSSKPPAQPKPKRKRGRKLLVPEERRAKVIGAFGDAYLQLLKKKKKGGKMKKKKSALFDQVALFARATWGSRDPWGPKETEPTSPDPNDAAALDADPDPYIPGSDNEVESVAADESERESDEEEGVKLSPRAKRLREMRRVLAEVLRTYAKAAAAEDAEAIGNAAGTTQSTSPDAQTINTAPGGAAAVQDGDDMSLFDKVLENLSREPAEKPIRMSGFEAFAALFEIAEWDEEIEQRTAALLETTPSSTAKRAVKMNVRRAYLQEKWAAATPEEIAEVEKEVEAAYEAEAQEYEKKLLNVPTCVQDAVEFTKRAEPLLARTAQAVAEGAGGAVLIFFAAPRETQDGQIEVDVSTAEYASIPASLGRRSLKFSAIERNKVWELGSRLRSFGEKIHDANWTSQQLRRAQICEDLTRRERLAERAPGGGNLGSRATPPPGLSETAVNVQFAQPQEDFGGEDDTPPSPQGRRTLSETDNSDEEDSERGGSQPPPPDELPSPKIGLAGGKAADTASPRSRELSPPRALTPTQTPEVARGPPRVRIALRKTTTPPSSGEAATSAATPGPTAPLASTSPATPTAPSPAPIAQALRPAAAPPSSGAAATSATAPRPTPPPASTSPATPTAPSPAPIAQALPPAAAPSAFGPFDPSEHITLTNALNAAEIGEDVAARLSTLAEQDTEVIFTKRAGWRLFLLEAINRSARWPVNQALVQELIKAHLQFEQERPTLASAAFVGWKFSDGEEGDPIVRPTWLRRQYTPAMTARWCKVASRGQSPEKEIMDWDFPSRLAAQWAAIQPKARRDDTDRIAAPPAASMDWEGRVSGGKRGVRIFVAGLLMSADRLGGFEDGTGAREWEMLASDVVLVLRVRAEQVRAAKGIEAATGEPDAEPLAQNGKRKRTLTSKMEESVAANKKSKTAASGESGGAKKGPKAPKGRKV